MAGRRYEIEDPDEKIEAIKRAGATTRELEAYLRRGGLNLIPSESHLGRMIDALRRELVLAAGRDLPERVKQDAAEQYIEALLLRRSAYTNIMKLRHPGRPKLRACPCLKEGMVPVPDCPQCLGSGKVGVDTAEARVIREAFAAAVSAWRHATAVTKESVALLGIDTKPQKGEAPQTLDELLKRLEAKHGAASRAIETTPLNGAPVEEEGTGE